MGRSLWGNNKFYFISVFFPIKIGKVIIGHSRQFEEMLTIYKDVDKLKKGALGFLSTAGNFIGNLLSPITNGISSLIGMLTGSGITGLIKAGFEGLVSSGALSTILAGAGITWGLSKIHDKERSCYSVS